MSYFLKLNAVSVLYAFMLFIAVELMVNVYRISRLTGIDGDVVNNSLIAIYLIGFILTTILFLFVTRKWMEDRNASYWTVVLWIPYFVVFAFIMASLFPIENPGEAPNPATGLLLIGAIILYPVYLALINFFGMSSVEEKKPSRLED